ncbi:MAG: phage portal protein [Bacteroides sp.]|nr:phage portal protein [Bacteroides sp.]
MDNKKNKNKAQKIALSILERKTYVPVDSTEYYSSGKDYVSWGNDNRYPSYLWDSYMQCSTLQSVINGCSDFTFGNGIENQTGIVQENEFGDTIADIVDKIILDRWIFGGFAIQVKYNILGTIIGLSYIDMRKCRVSTCGKWVFVHDKWYGWGTNRYNRFHSFNPGTGAENGVQIFFYRGAKTRGVYPVPDYSASLISAEIQTKIQQFNYNELDNNFAGTGVINFNNGVPEEEVQEKIEKKMNHKFAGFNNAGRFLVSFNDSKENEMTICRLDTDDLPERYSQTYETSRADIFISLRAHPQLFGMTVNTGFANIEYVDAFNLLNETHIKKKQEEIRRVFAKIFSREDAIVFKPFNPLPTHGS